MRTLSALAKFSKRFTRKSKNQLFQSDQTDLEKLVESKIEKDMNLLRNISETDDLLKEITKMGLSLSVVFSAVAGYLLGAETVDFKVLTLLAFGGYFMVGASNAYNQIIERDLDALMDRTKNRPIPSGRMSVNTAFLIAVLNTCCKLDLA